MAILIWFSVIDIAFSGIIFEKISNGSEVALFGAMV
jgi:hypothetical protein